MTQELLSFRKVMSADFPAMALLIERANIARDVQEGVETVLQNDLYDNLKAKSEKTGAWTDVVLLEETVAGFSLGYPATETTDLGISYPNADYISLLMVDPIAQGKGIASRLLGRAAERARQNMKTQSILLTREDDNTHARRVYEHKGYVQTGYARSSEYGRQILYLLDL